MAAPAFSHPGSRFVRVWNDDMDAYLREQRGADRTFRQIADQMAWKGYGHFSADAVRSRAKALGLIEDVSLIPREDEGPRDCRDRAGNDRLLMALGAAHASPPTDMRPSAVDGARFNWRRLESVAGSAGSPAALCAEG